MTNANGTCTVTASKATDANYVAATSAAATVTLTSNAVSYGAPSPTNPGSTITVTFTGGAAGCALASAQFTTMTPPTAVTMPEGAFSFTTTDCGSTSPAVLHFTITYPSIPAGAKYYKFGPEFGGSQTPHWYELTNAVISANQVSFSITDNGVGDSDSRPGFISDPGGIGVPNSPAPHLINLSTRGPVQTGDNVMIGGFVIGGSTPKKVLIRVVGPTLANYGVTGVLADPTLQLFSGQTPIAINNDWGSASNAAEVQAAALAPVNSLESAILATLNPGAYTAIVSGVSNGTGVAIVEVYDLDHPEAPLINISTRGKVQTGDGVMIGGFIIQGNGPRLF